MSAFYIDTLSNGLRKAWTHFITKMTKSSCVCVSFAPLCIRSFPLALENLRLYMSCQGCCRLGIKKSEFFFGGGRGGVEGQKKRGIREIQIMRSFSDLYWSPDINALMRWDAHVARVGEKYILGFAGETRRRRPRRAPRFMWEVNVQIYCAGIRC